MPDFIPVLVGGIVLFIIVFVGFAVPLGSPSGFFLADNNGKYNHVPLIDVESVSMDVYPVFNVDSSITSKEGSKTFVFETNTRIFKTGMIEFFIEGGNKYGEISFVLNNVELYSGYPDIGRHWLRFGPEIIRDDGNILEVKVTSPGWKFWEVAEYDFIVNIKGAIENTVERTFVLDSVNKPKLLMDFSYDRGNLAIELNGNRIYEDSPEGTLILDLEESLFLEKNTIEFLASPGARFDVEWTELVSEK